tara:strand:- start:865 stop:1437 length:573 start_codon:yes stop_codon:yes gene_type:complete
MSTYTFEKNSVLQQTNEYGIKKIITNFKTTTNGTLVATNIIPIWELNSKDIIHSNKTGSTKTIVVGRVVIKITDVSTTLGKDNSGNNKMIRLVGVNQNIPTNHPLSSLISSGTNLSHTVYGEGEIYKSNFYIDGHDSSLSTKINTYTNIVDLYKSFNSDKYFGLGLQIDITPQSGTILAIDTYVEVILVD